jgi:transcriptional regulator with XRE-family HTH domain
VALRGFVLELTRKQDLSQTEIARRSGLSQPLIHKILSGMGTPQMRTYQKLASAFPDAWSEYLQHHPSLRKELSDAFGWATERGEASVEVRRDVLGLFEASLGLDQLPPVPTEARERYQKRVREVMRRASRDLAQYRKVLLTQFRMRKGRGRSRKAL